VIRIFQKLGSTSPFGSTQLQVLAWCAL